MEYESNEIREPLAWDTLAASCALVILAGCGGLALWDMHADMAPPGWWSTTASAAMRWLSLLGDWLAGVA